MTNCLVAIQDEQALNTGPLLRVAQIAKNAENGVYENLLSYEYYPD